MPVAAATPCRTPFRKSLGDPTRVSRMRTHSPGAASADSGGERSVENGSASATSPRRRLAETGGGSSARARQSLRLAPAGRNSRDPRPVGDRFYAAQCARNVVDLLVSHNYGKTISQDKLLKDPSTKEFFDVFRFLIAQLDPQYEVEGKIEDEVPAIMKRLKYPVEVNRSKLQAISGPNTWPQLLAVLDWLAVLVRINDELIEPLASCELGLSDDSDHHFLRSLHENYVQFLSGADDRSDEERLRQVYEERIVAMRDEIQRLQDQQVAMDMRLSDFKVEHDRLVELQKAPGQLETEADRLRATLQSQEAHVQRIEADIVQAEEQEKEQLLELEEVQHMLRRVTVQVEAQPFSKKDIERLKCERGQLQKVLTNLRTDLEKAEQDVWELGMQESSRGDLLARLVRQVNESVESLDNALAVESGSSCQDLLLNVDLSQSTDTLEAMEFDVLHASTQKAIRANTEALQKEESVLNERMDEKRPLQQALAEKERERSRLRERLEQLHKTLEEYQTWSAHEIDDAQRTAEATEDALHAASIGTAAPTVREAAEVDKLRLELSALRANGAQEKHQLREQIRREEERFQDYRQHNQRELDAYVKDTEKLADEVMAALEVPLEDSERDRSARHGGG